MNARGASHSTVGAVLVAILGVACASESQSQTAGVMLPPGIRRALLGSLDSIQGTLDIMSGTQKVESFGPVTADAGGTLVLPFSNIPVGTYEFVVRVTGSKGSFADMPLAVYREPGIVISESQANNLVAASAAGSGQGQWELFTAGTADDDADDDGVSDLTELLFGTDPTSRFTVLTEATHPAQLFGVTGLDTRAVFIARGEFVAHPGSLAVRRATASDLVTPPPVRVERTGAWSNGAGTACEAGRLVRALQYVPNPDDPTVVGGLIGVGDGGCVVMGKLPNALAKLATQGVGFMPHETVDPAATGFSGQWRGVAYGGFGDSTGRYTMLLDSNGQARLESWPSTTWDAVSQVTLTASSVRAASGASWVGTFDRCGVMPYAVRGHELLFGSGTSTLTAPGSTIEALAHWRGTDERCHVLAAIDGGGGPQIVGASCALATVMPPSFGANCTLELDGSGATDTPGPFVLLTGMEAVTALEVGPSPLFPAVVGGRAQDALFAGDAAGQLWVAPHATANDADWQLVGLVPDGKAIRQLRVVTTERLDLDPDAPLSPDEMREQEELFRAQGWMPTLLVVTDEHVYRMP